MTHRTAATILALALALGACLDSHPGDEPLQLDANIPEPDQFRDLLQRDVNAYFATISRMRVTGVNVTLLRSEPTQSGVAYPKYYAWVELSSDSQDTMSGAVRVAAIDRTRFEVTDFINRETLLSDASAAAAIFPADLLPELRRRAQH